ncbi:hypothetical protein SRHO_G00271780 [Serrasalmus rhombeus]
MAKFNPPENFYFSLPEQWPEWRQRFERYRIATKLNKEDGEVKKELDRMVQCGVIEEIKEPTKWCAPMVPVKKKNGELCMC